ncbi:MAG: phage protease [Chloroflexi bacterium]|nr:phage protease [Chloroflexota bacterium]
MTVPTAPALATVPNVELIHTGTWNASTGEVTFTTADLIAAVAALECPAVRRPVLKMGHTDPRFDGEPAVGYITNLAVAENGRTLVGDYAGMPGWLGDVIASAFPDRSIEGQYDMRCQMGHVHPFVVTAVALLGVTNPAVGTLQSLQDVAALYGVAASSPTTGTAVTVHAKGDPPMPNPTPRNVAAGVTTEDVRRAFYGSPAGQSYDVWIEELGLDPMQLIVVHDETGVRERVPVTIGDGDGEEAVSFGDPIPVLIQYVDKASPSGVAASTRRQGALVFASRAESRPSHAPAATAGGPTQQEGAPVVTDDELTTLRTELNLAGDASFDDVLAAVKASKEPQPTTESDQPQAQPAPVAASDEALTELQRVSRELAEIKARQAADERKRLFDSVLAAGKITPAERGAWEKRYDQAPAVITDVLASIAPGTAVPVADVGHAGPQEEPADDALYGSLFGDDNQKVSA